MFPTVLKKFQTLSQSLESVAFLVRSEFVVLERAEECPVLKISNFHLMKETDLLNEYRFVFLFYSCVIMHSEKVDCQWNFNPSRNISYHIYVLGNNMIGDQCK